MTELTQDLSLAQARSLIDSYAFDLGGDDAEKFLKNWLDLYHASWIRLATIEALYLGRYKAISIEHILNVWLRLGTPNIHFTYEFERLICHKLPKHLNNLPSSSVNPPKIDAVDNIEQSNHQETRPIVPVKDSKQPYSCQRSISAASDNINPETTFGDRQNSSSDISLASALGLPYKSDWSEFTAGNKIIHQFIPLPDVSSFFNKLKTFGEEKLEG